MRALACLRGEAVEVLHYFGDALWEAPECSGGLEGHVLSHVPSHDLTTLLCFVKWMVLEFVIGCLIYMLISFPNVCLVYLCSEVQDQWSRLRAPKTRRFWRSGCSTDSWSGRTCDRLTSCERKRLAISTWRFQRCGSRGGQELWSWKAMISKQMGPWSCQPTSYDLTDMNTRWCKEQLDRFVPKTGHAL